MTNIIISILALMFATIAVFSLVIMKSAKKALPPRPRDHKPAPQAAGQCDVGRLSRGKQEF